MKTDKLIAGVILGAAAGALLGILFAPDKGIDTRKKISRKSGDWADGIKNKFNDFISSVSEDIEDTKEEAGELFENGRRKVSQMKSDVSKAL